VEALKSLERKVFLAAFMLGIALGWCWTFYASARLGAALEYGAIGEEVFYGYFLILAFLLLVVVPCLAYLRWVSDGSNRSPPARTRSDAHRLLWRQGGISLTQTLFFTLALAPCLAYSALVRGNDAQSVLWFLGWTVLASIILSLCGLLAAAILRPQSWHPVASPLALVGLGAAYLAATSAAYQLLGNDGLQFHSVRFWAQNLAALTAAVTTFALVYFVAAEQLLSPGERSSARPRIVILVQQALLTAWAGAAFVDALRDNSLRAERIIHYFAATSILYWFVMGVAMLGESSETIRPAACRGSRSIFGVALLRLFDSGSATGFLFAMANAIAASALAIAADFADAQTRSWAGWVVENHVTFVCLALGYLVLYLGLASATLACLRRGMTIRLRDAVLVQAILLCAGVALPWFVETAIVREPLAAFWRITDPFHTCAEDFDFSLPQHVAELRWVVGASAILVLAINLFLLAPQIARPAPRSID
jgi:hypothetical protein